jgi:hypothetical protein
MCDELHIEVVSMLQPDGCEHFRVRLHTRNNYWTIGRTNAHDKVDEVIDRELGPAGYALVQIWRQP